MTADGPQYPLLSALARLARHYGERLRVRVAQLHRVKLRCRDWISADRNRQNTTHMEPGIHARMDRWAVMVGIGLSALTVALTAVALFMR
jgi:hypothetical protein